MGGLDARILSGALPPRPEMVEVIAEARQLYLASGGSEEMFAAWAAAGASAVETAPRVLAYDSELPDFEVRDLNGRVWRRADLLGKATFIDIWATWCPPCREQHPELQKLHAALAGRKNMQVLSVSADETEWLASEYVKEKQYTFPVIMSKPVMERLFPIYGLPQGWMIDARGRRSAPYHFFSSAGAIKEMERAAEAR